MVSCVIFECPLVHMCCFTNNFTPHFTSLGLRLLCQGTFLQILYAASSFLKPMTKAKVWHIVRWSGLLLILLKQVGMILFWVSVVFCIVAISLCVWSTLSLWMHFLWPFCLWSSRVWLLSFTAQALPCFWLVCVRLWSYRFGGFSHFLPILSIYVISVVRLFIVLGCLV